MAENKVRLQKYNWIHIVCLSVSFMLCEFALKTQVKHVNVRLSEPTCTNVHLSEPTCTNVHLSEPTCTNVHLSEPTCTNVHLFYG